MTFTVFLLHVASGDLFELPFKSINYVEELNNGSQATFQFDFQTIKEDIATLYGTTVKDLFTAVFSEIWIENEAGTKIWYGVISEYSRTRDAEANYTLQIAAVDYFSLFQKRRTPASVVFTGADPATIPWSLIDASQLSIGAGTASDFGITVGATDSTGLTITQEFKFSNIRQAITDLSNYRTQGSFDFDIDYTKKLNIYYPKKGSLRANVVFDDNNILSSSVRIPVVLNITNSVYVTGQGINDDIANVNRQSSIGVINQYKLLEDVISDTQASDTTILSAEGDRHLALNELPLYAVSLRHSDDVDITTYGLGDTVVVNIPEENISYDQYRVKRRTVDIDQANTIVAGVDLLTI